MATNTKPAGVPRWNDSLANNLEPAEAKKDTGWLFGEKPSSAFENWRTNLNGDWWKWINERFADGVSPDELDILDPDTTNPMAHISAVRLHWLTAAGVEFRAEAGIVTAGRTITNGINLKGVGNVKSIEFDGATHGFQYDVSAASLTVRNNSATPSLTVTAAALTVAKPIIAQAVITAQAGVVASAGQDVAVSGAGRHVHGNQTFLFSSLPGQGGTWDSGNGYRTITGGGSTDIPIDVPSGVTIASIDVRYRHSITGAGSPLQFRLLSSSEGTITELNTGQTSEASPTAGVWAGHSSTGLAVLTGGNSQYYIQVANVSGNTNVDTIKIVWAQT